MGGSSSKEGKEGKEEDISQLGKLYKAHGDKGFKSILVKEKSPHQSLSYQNIHKECMSRVENIEKDGNQIINDYIERSEKDYKKVVRDLTEKNPDQIKKAQVGSKKTLKQIVGYDQQMEKYEDIRNHMKQNFDVGREEMENDIREQCRIHQGVDTSQILKGYDDQPEEKKKQLLRGIEEQFVPRMLKHEEKQRKSARTPPNHFTFEFTKNYKQRFEELVPEDDCKAARKSIKLHFEKEVAEALGTNNVCC